MSCVCVSPENIPPMLGKVYVITLRVTWCTHVHRCTYKTTVTRRVSSPRKYPETNEDVNVNAFVLQGIYVVTAIEYVNVSDINDTIPWSYVEKKYGVYIPHVCTIFIFF